MRKFTKEEYIKRTDEIEQILFDKLQLRKLLSNEKLEEFLTTMIAYIEHSNTKEIAGRTSETIDKHISRFIEFCKKIGLTDLEIIETITKFPSIIHSSSDLEQKYILLSIIENEENTLRKTKLIERPRDYNLELEKIYARISLANTLNYKLTWNNLMKNTEKEFAEIFTKTSYNKPHKIFNELEECSSERLKAMYPLDINFINELRNLEINKNLTDEGKKNGK